MSRSNSSIGSSASSHTRRLMAAEEAEAARVELKYHDMAKRKQTDLDRKRMEFEEANYELTRLEIMKKIDIAEAKLKAINRIDFEEEHVTIDNIDHNTSEYLSPPKLSPQIFTNCATNEFVSPIDVEFESLNLSPVKPLTKSTDKNHIHTPVNSEHKISSATQPTVNTLTDICNVISDQSYLNRLPSPEPRTFSGDPLEFPAWKASFQGLIESKNIPFAQRMYYLQKYLDGPARKCVENYFLFNTEDSYNNARALLENRYGNQFTIACAFRNKLEKWVKISSRDGEGLRQFSDFLRQCESAMHTVPSLHILNDSMEIQKLVEKLPDWIYNRWSRISYDMQQNRMAYPRFSDFVSFLTKEADILCDPLSSFRNEKRDKNYSPVQNKTSVQTRSTPYSHKYVQKQLKGNNSLSLKTEAEASDSNSMLKNCFYCKSSHHISECSDLNKKSLDERKQYYFTNNLCFACLNLGHRSQNCRNRLKCKKCVKYHPTSLHGDFKHKSEETIPKSVSNSDNISRSVTSHTSFNNASAKSKSSMIVPVYLSHDDNPQNELLIYALEDTQSDSTFVLSKSAETLGLKGVDICLALSTMTVSNERIQSIRYTGLSVRKLNSNIRYPLPPTYSRDIMPANRSHIPVPSMVEKWPHLERIRNELYPLLNCDVGLLIGYDCPKLLAPLDVIPPENNGPFAQETVLGWGIVGILDWETVPNNDNIGISHRIMTSVPSTESYISCRTKLKEVIDPSAVLKMFELDFSEHKLETELLSNDDKLFLDKMSKGIHISSDNHYEMPLPFKGPDPDFPNNRNFALSRMYQLKNRLRHNSKLYNDYSAFMTGIIEKGFAEVVPSLELSLDSHVWYIPHHAVYHPKKDKIRIVFSCNVNYKGSALNDCLLKGPDLTNTLLGVLCRFRQHPIAYTCDISQMFYNFKVNECHRNYLRFLWWKNNDINSELVDYRMTVHLFGAASSPGCANFGLKQAASDNEHLYNPATVNFIREDFYVDDGLKSVETESEAIDIIQNSKSLLAKYGIRLHKFVSNSTAVIDSVDMSDRAQGIQNLDLCVEQLPIERVLGVHWHVEMDKFNFHITLKDKPLTRRGILSTISSIFDPLGFISPFILIGKQILQELCRENMDWDERLPDHLRPDWERWRNEVMKLELVELDRCVKPKDFKELYQVEIHHFSDACNYGYGQCSYLRLIDITNNVYCSLLLGKSRVVPLRAITIPRLELSAAVVSAKISQFLDKELRYDNVKHIFWTDSTVVMGYIRNDVRRFQTFVSNRIQTIRDISDPNQWNYVKSSENPADVASRGAFVNELIKSNWFTGPNFLWSNNPIQSDLNVYELSPTDPELKKTVSFAAHIAPSFDLDRLSRFSNWFRLKRAVANCLRLKNRLRNKVLAKSNPNKVIQPVNDFVNVSDLCESEIEIIKLVQYESFKDEIDYLRKLKNSDNPPKRFLKKSSSLFRLDPFLNPKGLLCVGGRLRMGNLSVMEKYPVILPRKHFVTNLVIRHYHELSQHQGRGITTNVIRANGYWIIGCSSAVYEHIDKCVNCRKFRGRQQSQKMADIPDERLEPSPPFSVCAVDCFGPFLIKVKRSELKRYGLLFTCLCSRAVHIEVLHNMTSDSFINGLRRLIAIRGPIRSLYCDNGTNFVGAKSELFDLLKNLDQEAIRDYLLRNNCDYFEFKFNVPHASHMGGIWERQIRSVRNVLISLLNQCGTQLDDESLNTFMFEAAAIVNSRPLSVINLNDPKSCEPLTPNHLIMMKSSIVLPPPGNFVREDIYSRKRWRRVQYLCNVFWSRWKTEYLQNLQTRQKWNKPVPNLKVGDIVLLIEENIARNQWKLCRVIQTIQDGDNLVRKVKIVVGNKYGNSLNPVTLERPVNKLVLIVD